MRKKIFLLASALLFCYAIDNLTYAFDGGGYSVPEPGTMILLGSGLFGLAVFRRKRVKNNSQK